MAKSSKKRKQPQGTIPSQAVKKQKQIHETIPVEDTASRIGDLIYEDELDTTTETLALLAQNPHLIGLKPLKLFRTAVHDYWRAATEASLTGTLPSFLYHNLKAQSSRNLKDLL